MLTEAERERERALFEAERKRAPELFERAPMVDDERFLRHIGIEEDAVGRPIGYLRLRPQDFIVEEIDAERKLHNTDDGDFIGDPRGEGETIYADLVKAGVSTLEAKHQLAALARLDEKQIGFAGIKDRLAITSQRISIRGLGETERLEGLQADNFFVKEARRGKGVVANGDLWGNRFIITVRLAQPLATEEEQRISEKTSDIRREGFWNFFSFQRFGTPRLLGHILGKHIVRGAYEDAVRTFIVAIGERELPYFANIRNDCAKYWGDWERIRDKMRGFPYHFALELRMLRYLVEHPSDFLGALHELPDQVRLWMYAYDCSLFNKKLSELIREGSVPAELPLATSFNPLDWAPYREFLDADEVRMPNRAYKDFPFVRIASRTWPVLQKAEMHGTEFRGRLAVFGFSLPKGSYATTFLNNFFTLASGLPAVEGISEEKIDAKEVLGLGALAPTLERFKKVLEEREKDIAAEE